VLHVRLGFALFGVFWGTWAVAALDVQRFLGLSNAELGFLVAATVVGTSATNVIGGTLAERRGLAPAITFALAVWGPLVLLIAAVGHEATWMATFLVAVAAGGLLDVVLNVGSTELLVGRPGRLLRAHATYNVGTVAGAAITGAVLALEWSWRWSFAVAGIGSIVLAAFVRWRPGDLPAEPSPAGAHVTLRDAAAELRRSRLGGLAVMFALGAMVEGGIGTFGVLYLRDRLEVAVLAGAGAYVVGQSLATVTRLSLGTAASEHRLAGTSAARLGLAVASAGLALEAATDLPGVAAVGLAIASIGVATYWPLLTAVASGASDRPGLAVGGVSAAGYLGFLAGPPLVGAVAEGAGLRAGVLVLALAGAAAASIPLRTMGRPPRRAISTKPADENVESTPV
jgi:MFS family permease